MTTSWPELDRIQFEPSAERLKVTLPTQRNWPYIVLYTLLLLVWLGSLLWAVVFLLTGPRGSLSGVAFFIYALVVLLLFYLWFRLGGQILRWWQYFLANREILFIDKEMLIVRRPLSIFGVTDAYDMAHVAPFFYSEQHHSPAFRYGNKAILFGKGLTQTERGVLLARLNEHFFPGYDDEDI